MHNTLYIIGNGFDLHHGLRTSYKDFRDDNICKNKWLRDMLRVLYGNRIYEDLWWSDFENMLGQVDYTHILESNNGIVLGPLEVRNLLEHNLQLFFGEWLSKIVDFVEPGKRMDIDKDSMFFSFNYTMVLEKSYQVKSDNIWHIHNSLKDFKHGTNIIVGHDLDSRQLMLLKKGNPELLQSSFVRSIDNEILTGAKGVSRRINSNTYRFQQYSNIKHIIVLGFSFNDIDVPYIKKIIAVNHNISETDWTLYWHAKGEDLRMKNKLQKLGINQDSIITRNW